MRVLVVGGTGFIGAHVVRRLAAAGHHVTVYQHRATDAELPPGVETRRGDRADPAALGAAVVEAVPDASLPEPFGYPLQWRQHLVGDTRKLRAQLGYTEPVPPDEALRRTVGWERAHPPAAAPPVDFGAEDAALAARR